MLNIASLLYSNQHFSPKHECLQLECFLEMELVQDIKVMV